MEALGQKDRAMTGSRMPLWHLPIPILRNGGTCTQSLRLPAHFVCPYTGNLLKHWSPSSRKASRKNEKEKLCRQRKLSLHQLRKRRHIGSEEP
eukprot:1138730-Pelagomonas_calceolata.AAC.8